MRLVEETFVAEAHVNRRLAAILCADVAGYARLMGDDEERTLGGFSDENRAGAVRHGHAAIAHGRDDATALALGAFVIAMVEHDRVTACEAFEQALALSPSCSFALFSGCVALAWGGEADRAIEWAKCALRISQVDRLNHLACHGLAVGHFLRGRYEEAADAGRR